MARPISTRLKVERAKIHLDSLDVAVAEFRREPEKSQRVTSYDDPEHSLFVVECESLDDEVRVLPLAVIAGDFISNLRAALDHMVRQIAMLAGAKASRDICFPVIGEDSLDAQLKITRSTYALPEEAIS